MPFFGSICIVLALSVLKTTGFLLNDNTSKHCTGIGNVTHVSIPRGIHMAEFDTIIQGNRVSELYFALPNPPAFNPDINYFARFHKINDTHYIRRSIAETPASSGNSVPKCAEGTIYMEALTGYNTTQFYLSSSVYTERLKLMQVMWSKCPRRYIWSMRCAHYNEGNTACPVEAVTFGLYITDSIDDLPIPDILDDLGRTGVTFGSSVFKWKFTYGENRLCDSNLLNILPP